MDFLWFAVIFQNCSRGVIWPILQSSRGDTDSFVGWGYAIQPPIGERVFHYLPSGALTLITGKTPSCPRDVHTPCVSVSTGTAVHASTHTHGPSTKQMTQACVRPATRSAQRPPHTNTTHSTDGRYATDVYSRARPAERRPSAPVADRCAQPRWSCVGSHRTTLRCTTWAQAEGVPLVQCKHRIISYWDTTARLDGILRDEILERGKRRTNPCFIYSSTVQQSLATAADA
jgi:hypothetical protein